MPKHTVTLPSVDGKTNVELICEGNLVIVGANGSGKSRLGAWIEKHVNKNTNAHRISAQRALTIPDYAEVKNYIQASNELLFGNQDQLNNKDGYRWGGDPFTFMLNDYGKVLSALFASEAKRNEEYVALARSAELKLKSIQPVNSESSSDKIEVDKVSDSPIDTLEKLWKDILPHREIMLEDGKVNVHIPGGVVYHGKSMSDGERVALYLIGQCLCAPKNSILIIDEPEIHLHKSLMSRLWTSIEEKKPDCLFIYITHDIDFAASRTEAKKIWIKSYSDDKWNWEELSEVEGIPDSLLLEIVGNRKKVLFVEGEKGSLDNAIYQAIYSDYFVVPRGSCHKVIESTKAVNGNEKLLHLKAKGIIDRDFRAQEELTALESSGIFSIDVAEVENILCLSEVINIIAVYLIKDPSIIISQVTDFIIKELEREMETQVSSRTANEIQFKLNAFNKKAKGTSELELAKKSLIESIDTYDLYKLSQDTYQLAIDNRDLNQLLKVYNMKSLAKRISTFLGLKNEEYPNLVIRLLKSNKKVDLVLALKAFAPVLD
jgi:uncharacterized protein DUF4435/putative AbiEii toxin of type IV toxin-antitoxin system